MPSADNTEVLIGKMKSFDLGPIDFFADANHRAFEHQFAIGLKLAGQLGADATLRIVNLGAIPLLVIGIVLQSVKSTI